VKVELVIFRNGEERPVIYDYIPREEGEKPMALDVLLQAQATEISDLSFRYGCRNRSCGLCTIDINGRPRIGCRARVREGDRISAPGTLPVVRDMVSKRDGIARQLRGKLPNMLRGNNLNVEAPEDYHALTACIECYACLDNCPMHQRNFDEGVEQRDEGRAYRSGNPFSLLKLQRIRLDPVATEEDSRMALEAAVNLGLDACYDCPGCKCGVGIDLKGKVIKPLMESGKGFSKSV
jgi:succinate dehydrogenase / fumarate reductase iron-sulfur subunit